MKIGCFEVPEPSYLPLLLPAEWKTPAPFCLCYLMRFFPVLSPMTTTCARMEVNFKKQLHFLGGGPSYLARTKTKTVLKSLIMAKEMGSDRAPSEFWKLVFLVPPNVGGIINKYQAVIRLPCYIRGAVHTFQGKCGKQISKGHWRLADLVICSPPADIIFKQNIEETSEHV